MSARAGGGICGIVLDAARYLDRGGAKEYVRSILFLLESCGAGMDAEVGGGESGPGRTYYYGVAGKRFFSGRFASCARVKQEEEYSH